MKPKMALNVLQMAGIVRPVSTQPDDEYAFRHGLLQETAYRSLLKQDRERMHLQVGETIETTYPDRRNELAALLADHFLRGGDSSKALHYFQQAAQNARGRYANTEAVEYYSAALDLVRDLSIPGEEAELLRERGLTYEIVGDFDSARADYEAALALGQELYDQRITWRAQLDLGKLWAARDYARTGDYFLDALATARQLGDQVAIARSLNRLGNWHINRSEPDKSVRYHEEALGIFKNLENERGIAETLDFLGMTHLMASNMETGAQYYEQAVSLLRSLGEERRLISALTGLALRIGYSQSDTVVGLDVPIEQALNELNEATRLAEEINWKAGESFSLWTTGFVLSAAGEFSAALEAAKKGLELADEIEHVQWVTAACCAVSRVYMRMLDHESALPYLERARELARRMDSNHWIAVTTAMFANAYIEAGEFDRAEGLLAEVKGPELGQMMLGDRLCWYAIGELELAREQYQPAWSSFNELIEAAPGYDSDAVIPRLFHSRGLASLGLEQWEDAQQDFEAALKTCEAVGAVELAWKLHAALCRAYRGQGMSNEAAEHRRLARAAVKVLSNKISSPEQSELFRTRAEDYIDTCAGSSADEN